MTAAVTRCDLCGRDWSHELFVLVTVEDGRVIEVCHNCAEKADAGRWEDEE